MYSPAPRRLLAVDASPDLGSARNHHRPSLISSISYSRTSSNVVEAYAAGSSFECRLESKLKSGVPAAEPLHAGEPRSDVLFGPWLLDVLGTRQSLALGAAGAVVRWGDGSNCQRDRPRRN